MLTDYFSNFDKLIRKKVEAKKKASAKTASKKSSSKKAPSGSVEPGLFADKLAKIIPAKLQIDSVRPVDNAGYSPDGADLLAYRKYCEDIVELMGGYIPYELVYGTFFLVKNLGKSDIPELLGRVEAVKKLNRFTDDQVVEFSEESTVVPAFIIINDTDYSMLDLKNDITNYYISKGVDSVEEMDLMMVINKGIVVKDWRENRTFTALETEKDTMMWFFVLMNEYLDMERNTELDFRKYIKTDTVYAQY